MNKYIYMVALATATLGIPFMSAFADVSEPIQNSSNPSEVLINHAFNGSIVSASNYDGGNVPGGIGIPHTLINSIPEGDYFAVVFFEGLIGCPTNNYAINSFRAGLDWGYDIRGEMLAHTRAASSAGGGCMQEFHVDPARGGDWLWGAISNTGTTSAIADLNGIPAFAICASKQACDPVIPGPSGEITPNQNQQSGISSVLFLPGIKGSKLYEDNPLCLVPGDGCDLPVWLPTSDATALALYMDEAGKSVRNLYTKEGVVIANAYGYHFYDSLTNMMQAYHSQASSNSTWDWKPAAYDWRMSLPDIVKNGTKQGSRIYFETETDTPYIEQSLRALASTSPTGKVTIIAHSNGGLVAKELMRRIGDIETARLIDKVILVGVPQTGAPRALASLLYGEGGSLPGVGVFPDALMSAAHARTFGHDSPMAYHLLPSESYFNDVNDPAHPILRFGEGSLLAQEHVAYGDSIDNTKELREYALGLEGGRTMPSERNLHEPNLLNANLLQYAQDIHSNIDNWQPPDGVNVYQVVGWGEDTLSGIETYEQSVRKYGVLTKQTSYRPMFTEDGDGIVTAPSAAFMAMFPRTHTYWVSLPEADSSNMKYDHGTLLEVPAVLNLIQSILEGSNSIASGITQTRPSQINAQKKLLFVLHGPASLKVSDTQSHSTGTSGGSLIHEIPGSSSGVIGEATYALIPASGEYSIEIRDMQSEDLELDIQDVTNGFVGSSATVADIPGTPNTIARLSVVKGIEEISPILITKPGSSDIEYSADFTVGTTTFPTLATSTEVGDALVHINAPTVTASSGGSGGIISHFKKSLSKKKVVMKKIIKKRHYLKSKRCRKNYCPTKALKTHVTKRLKGPARK